MGIVRRLRYFFCVKHAQMILNVKGLHVPPHLCIASEVNGGVVIVISLPLGEVSAAEALERDTSSNVRC